MTAGRRIIFENFGDGAPAVPRLAALRAAVEDPKPLHRHAEIDPYQQGYVAGAAVSADEFEEAKSAFLGALDDISRMRQEVMRKARLDSLELVARIINAVSPKLSLGVLLTEIGAAVQSAHPDEKRDRLEISACLSTLTRIEPAISVNPALAFAADDALSPGAMRIRWIDGGLDIDADAAIAAILAVVQKHISQLKEEDPQQ